MQKNPNTNLTKTNELLQELNRAIADGDLQDHSTQEVQDLLCRARMLRNVFAGEPLDG
jgi:NTP pyrophosphatase (non-canonical NTP hydrolase)